MKNKTLKLGHVQRNTHINKSAYTQVLPFLPTLVANSEVSNSCWTDSIICSTSGPFLLPDSFFSAGTLSLGLKSSSSDLDLQDMYFNLLPFQEVV